MQTMPCFDERPLLSAPCSENTRASVIFLCLQFTQGNVPCVRETLHCRHLEPLASLMRVKKTVNAFVELKAQSACECFYIPAFL